MKKVRLVIALLLLLVVNPSHLKGNNTSNARSIPMHKIVRHQRLRSEEPCVMVSFEQKNLLVDVSRYIGNVNIVISDDNGCVVSNNTIWIEGKASELIDFSALSPNTYYISIEVGDLFFYGFINI